MRFEHFFSLSFVSFSVDFTSGDFPFEFCTLWSSFIVDWIDVFRSLSAQLRNERRTSFFHFLFFIFILYLWKWIEIDGWNEPEQSYLPFFYFQLCFFCSFPFDDFRFVILWQTLECSTAPMKDTGYDSHKSNFRFKLNENKNVHHLSLWMHKNQILTPSIVPLSFEIFRYLFGLVKVVRPVWPLCSVRDKSIRV